MQATVQMQGQAVAGGGPDALKDAHHPPAGIGFDIFAAHSAQQLIFVVFLDTNFADGVGAAVGHGIDILTLAFVNTPHITNHMGKKLAVGVKASEAGGNFGALQPEAIDR